MTDVEEITELREVLVRCCRRLHDLLVQGTLIGWLDVPVQLIGDLAAMQAQIERTQARLRQYRVVVADWTGELNSLTPFGLLVSEPVLKEAEGLWTSNRYEEAVSVLRSAYATRNHDYTFTQRYLQYWYLLAVRAVILGQPTVARHAAQEVVHLDPEYKNALELLDYLERQRRGELGPPTPMRALPASRSLHVEPHAKVPKRGTQWVFSALAKYGRVLIAGVVALIVVVLLIDLGRSTRAQIGTSPVPSASVIRVAPEIAVAPLTATSGLESENSVSTSIALLIVSPTAAPTALPSPTPTECGTKRVDASALRVRDVPRGTVLHTVYQGTKVTLTCETQMADGQQWVKVWVTADPRIMGWVSANYLK